jgi:hypothetical protein
MVAFPMIGRLVGGALSLVFWLVVGVVIVAIFQVMAH